MQGTEILIICSENYFTRSLSANNTVGTQRGAGWVGAWVWWVCAMCADGRKSRDGYYDDASFGQNKTRIIQTTRARVDITVLILTTTEEDNNITLLCLTSLTATTKR